MIQASTSVLGGLEAQHVAVEVFTRRTKTEGHFRIVGLADSAVKESRERIQTALRAVGISLPNQVLVNLAPAELKKEGTSLELGIVMGLLSALRVVAPKRIRSIHCVGEISLDGYIRPVRGFISHLLAAIDAGKHFILANPGMSIPTYLEQKIRIVEVQHITQVIELLTSEGWPRNLLRATTLTEEQESVAEHQCQSGETSHPFTGVFGQARAKRALVVAATGGHNILFVGPPGAGKTMLAERFTRLLPSMESQELTETLRIYSAMNLSVEPFLKGLRPFRHPHYGSSEVALCGGGSVPQPGEVSLSHNGVLFLDEFPEFRRSVLESLRVPLESGKMFVSRARGRVCFPARFILLAAMNPCPCGYFGFSGKSCSCSQSMVEKYLHKLSGPLLDRIDMQLGVESVPLAQLRSESADIQGFENVVEQVEVTRALQIERQGKINGALSLSELLKSSDVGEETFQEAESLARRFFFSTRSVLRLLRLSRTIADLEGSVLVQRAHLVEAFGFRLIDKWKGEMRSFY